MSLKLNMQSSISDKTDLYSVYTRARQHMPELQAIVVLRLGDDHSMMAWGTGKHPSGHLLLPLGLSGLANRISSNDHLSELAMERIIAEVEDIVMPLRAKLPVSAKLFSQDPFICEVAHWGGMPAHTMQWQLGIDTVEQLFNRQVALAQGRPASQDDLPTTGKFSATLLVLREWLHHLHFIEITVLNTTEPVT